MPVQDAPTVDAVNTRLSQAIDHTKLTFAAGEDETQAIETLCAEARQFNFFAVCVRPRHIQLSKKLLAGSGVKVATVIGFPNEKIKLESEQQNQTVGNFAQDHKVAETVQAVKDGVDELDLVINVGQLKRDVQNGTTDTLSELQAIYQAAADKPVKVIIETDLLNSSEIEQITRWCVDSKMFMVKTSTGMVDGGVGARIEDVTLIHQTLRSLNANTSIKASGGIKTREQALALLDAGAERLGTSAGTSLVQAKTVDPNAY